MKRYYELIGQRLVVELDFEKGYIPTVEDVSEYLHREVREITKKEFNELGDKYSNS